MLTVWDGRLNTLSDKEPEINEIKNTIYIMVWLRAIFIVILAIFAVLVCFYFISYIIMGKEDDRSDYLEKLQSV